MCCAVSTTPSHIFVAMSYGSHFIIRLCLTSFCLSCVTRLWLCHTALVMSYCSRMNPGRCWPTPARTIRKRIYQVRTPARTFQTSLISRRRTRTSRLAARLRNTSSRAAFRGSQEAAASRAGSCSASSTTRLASSNGAKGSAMCFTTACRLDAYFRSISPCIPRQKKKRELHPRKEVRCCFFSCRILPQKAHQGSEHQAIDPSSL